MTTSRISSARRGTVRSPTQILSPLVLERFEMSDKKWPAKGDRMTFLGKNGYEFELRDAMNKFEVGEELEVEDCNVGNWSHSVKFAGREGWYNGVMFKFSHAIG